MPPKKSGKGSTSAIKRKVLGVKRKCLKRRRPVSAHKPMIFSSRSAQAQPDMSSVVVFGQTTDPSLIVVVLHALGDFVGVGGTTLADAEKCTRGLKGAMVVLPQAQDICTWCNPADPRFDWLRQRGTQDTSDRNANKREVQRVVRARLAQLNTWLDRLLERHQLTNSELILIGFSQGTILASILGARRRVLGVGLCGGVPSQGIYSAQLDTDLGGWKGWWFGFEEFIPESCKSARRLPQFCFVNGSKDTCVSKRKNEAMFKAFPKQWHWDIGKHHAFTAKWMFWINKWILKLVNPAKGNE